MENKALVVIDLQNDITKNYKLIIERVNTAIDWASENAVPKRAPGIGPGRRAPRPHARLTSLAQAGARLTFQIGRAHV